MGRMLIALGLVLLIGAIGTHFLWAPSEAPRMVKPVEKLGLGAVETMSLSPDEVNGVIEYANERADTVNESGINYKEWAGLCFVCALVFGAVISIVSGCQKIRIEREYPASGPLTVAAGVLGSLTAIATAAGQHLQSEAERQFRCVDEIQEKVTDTVTDVRGETDPVAARQYLHELRREVDRCQ